MLMIGSARGHTACKTERSAVPTRVGTACILSQDIPGATAVQSYTEYPHDADGSRSAMNNELWTERCRGQHPNVLSMAVCVLSRGAPPPVCGEGVWARRGEERTSHRRRGVMHVRGLCIRCRAFGRPCDRRGQRAAGVCLKSLCRRGPGPRAAAPARGGAQPQADRVA